MTVDTGSNGTQPGNIRLLTDLNYNGIGTGKTLTLSAANDIDIQTRIYDSNTGGAGDSLNLVFNGNGNVGLTTYAGASPQISTNGGNVTIQGNSYNGAAGTINTTGLENQPSGNVLITTNGDLIAGNINTSGGSANNQSGTAGGSISLTSTNGSVYMQGELNSEGGDGDGIGGFNAQSMPGGSGSCMNF